MNPERTVPMRWKAPAETMETGYGAAAPPAARVAIASTSPGRAAGLALPPQWHLMQSGRAPVWGEDNVNHRVAAKRGGSDHCPHAGEGHAIHDAPAADFEQRILQ